MRLSLVWLSEVKSKNQESIKTHHAVVAVIISPIVVIIISSVVPLVPVTLVPVPLVPVPLSIIYI